MTKRPSSEAGRPHSDAASRLAALLADVAESPAPPGEPEATTAASPRKDAGSTRVRPEGAPASTTGVGGSAPRKGPPSTPDRRPRWLPAVPPDPSSAIPDLPGAARGPESTSHQPRLGRVTLRSVAFGTALVVLVVAIPALAWVGQERILRSKGGEVVEGGADPSEPGYRALVNATPTALVIHRDADETPLSATLLALGAGDSGGTVLQIPLSTRVRHQRLLIDRLSGVYGEGGEGRDELFIREIEDRLGVDFPEGSVIDLDDESLASLAGPVAPIAIENPDPTVAPDGVQEFPAGPLNLSAEQVGPFLAATRSDETELGRLARNELFWTAWLEAIGSMEGSADDSIGTATTGIGPFLRVLSSGEAVVDTLDVAPPEDADAVDPPLDPAKGMEEQIIAAVPYPRSPRLGRRFGMRLLNGADGEPLPMTLIHDLILAGGSLQFLGNAQEFGRERTLAEFGRPWKNAGEAVDLALGGDVAKKQVSRARAEAAGSDVVITIGSDILEEYRNREAREGG